ncbi:MAG: JAB domain-containing protein [Saprospiraceae bacterium]
MKNPRFWQVSEVQLSYHSQLQTEDYPKVTASIDAEKLFRENWSDDMELYEEFIVLFLNKANQVKGLFRASRGGSSATVVDLKIVFAAAVKAMASGIIVAHNHPSGNLAPSQADIDLTRKLRIAGEVLEMPLLDHIILAPNKGFYSFADEHMI